MRIIFLALLSLLCACSSGNSIVIGKQANNSPLRLTSDGLYIDPALLGMPQDADISVHTSADSEITFNVENIPDAKDMTRNEGKAF